MSRSLSSANRRSAEFGPGARKPHQEAALCGWRFLPGCALTVAFVAAFIPAVAFAQSSSIAGVVTDTTGAVLPGVTVEAASPALIEGSRSVVTDGSGRYAIVELRPGTFTVTFTLPGFRVGEARRHRAGRRFCRERQRATARRRRRGDGHGVGRVARRGRAERREAIDHLERRHRRHPHRQELVAARHAHGRRDQFDRETSAARRASSRMRWPRTAARRATR